MISGLLIAMIVMQLLIAEQQVFANLENLPKKHDPTKLVDQPVSNLSKTNVTKPQNKDFVAVSQAPMKKSNESFDKNVMPEDANPAESESSSLTQGVIVIVSLTMIFFIFLAIRVFRAPRGPNVIVKKYGVRARRCDVEMEPLPLDDEEDETVFELGNFTKH
ncbi:unnamed protein product [Callosobruchus maculatus]|uniref:Resistance to inhibitors of cholinesterase protein 3 N-terminal domain-containing protein n=1 Tax=Callosobruchus maculatus TaxID=64391 RepID=A0A653C190_CALMS|nr:unnamed protein product [Callosobruchus maculatus]